MKITRENANDLLMKEFTEMKKAFNDDGEYDNDTTHPFFSCEFVPFVMQNLKQGDVAVLHRIFSFIENLLTSGDDFAQNLAHVSIIEPIYQENGLVTYKPLIYKLCGQQTKESFEYWESGVHWQNGEREKS